MTPPLTIWIVWDRGADDDSAGGGLFAARYGWQAVRMWHHWLGLAWGEAQVGVRRAEWAWPTVPEPAPSVPGPWMGHERTEFGPAYLGFGVWYEDDPECIDCGDHYHRDDIVVVDDESVCRWCAAQGPG